MSDNWGSYFANVNDELASLYVDIGVEGVPDSERPWLLWTWVHVREPREDGLSSSAETPVLYRIEDALIEAVKKGTGADLVGRITTAGMSSILRPNKNSRSRTLA
jgi:hypothetical protein